MLFRSGFAPRINPENFKAPFTASEGWGSYTQQRNEKEFSSKIIVEYGQLKLNEIAVELDIKQTVKNVQVFLNYKANLCSFEQVGTKCIIKLNRTAIIKKGYFLSVKAS